MLPRPALTFALVLLLFSSRAIAQTSQSESDGVAPAHVSHVEGAVTLEREGRQENSPLNMPLLSGDRLKTLDGRAEVLFADGSALHLDSRTTLDIQSDDLVRLIDGRLRLAIAGRTFAYRIDSPAGSVRISQPGEYKLSMLQAQNETQLELAVVRGAAEIFTDQGATPVRAGERAYASAGLAPSYAYTYNSANWDAFDRWSEARRDTRLGASAQYLPEDVRPYAATLEEHGDWRYEQTYGYVWYPHVAATWRPYYYGRWVSYPRYGWTWVGVDTFAWPTHHYGRWGFSAGSWFWIPSAHWAPAYVSWAYAPGYVSWCPLGFNNHAVFGFGFNVGVGYYSPYAWTSVSYNHFGHNYYVHQRAEHWDNGHPAPHFAVASAAPAYRAATGSGTATPIRWAGSRNLPPGGGSYAAATARADVAVPRGSGASVVRPAGGQPAVAQPLAGQAPGSRDVAVMRGITAPRYVNHGDQIVRSVTERPTPPAPGSHAAARTAPEAAVRRADGAPLANASGAARPDPPGYSRARDPRSDVPGYQPRTTDSRGAAAPANRSGSPGAAEVNPAYRPRYDPPAHPVEYARPQSDPRPSPPPSAGTRQAPAAPPQQQPSGPAGGGERAAPRQGPPPAAAGSMPARRGGRGGI